VEMGDRVSEVGEVERREINFEPSKGKV